MTTAILMMLLAGIPLVSAVKAGYRATALRLIERHADVNAPEPDGTTALHWAIVRHDFDLAERLLRAGADPKAKNVYGATPMSEAAVFGDPALLQKLLDAGADVESPNGDGQTALMLVARTGNVEAARLLLNRGADVNASERWRGQTSLMWAAAERQPDMVRELISHGALVDARSDLNQWRRQVTSEPRALHRPMGGLTPLLFSAREGCLACARALLDAGADIDLGDPDEISPLLIAITNAHFDLAAALLERGANPNKWDWFGRTPLYAAVDMNTIPHGGRADGPSLDNTTSLQIVERLLAAGANANAQLKLLPPYRNVIDDRVLDAPLTIGASPLLRAAKAFDADVTRLLLAHGANVSLPNIRGVTPLMAAAGMGSTDADTRGVYTTKDTQQRAIASIELLLAAGADVNARDGGRGLTALHEAARWGWDDVIKCLIAHGADVRARDNRGMTPVDSALGRAGGNSKFGQRIDVFQGTAALLRDFGGAEGAPADNRK
jgi:ankyrin